MLEGRVSITIGERPTRSIPWNVGGEVVSPVAGIEVSVWVPLVAGLAGIYGDRDLIGKQVVVPANLEPVTLMGVESRGMLLAAEDGSGVHILTPDAETAPGSKVR